MNGAGPFAGTCSEQGDFVQEAAPGIAPMHTSPTVPAKPFVELMSRLVLPSQPLSQIEASERDLRFPSEAIRRLRFLGQLGVLRSLDLGQ
jgi:hypothetical protein